MIGGDDGDTSKYDVSVPPVRTPVDETDGGATGAMPELQTDQVGYGGGRGASRTAARKGQGEEGGGG